LTPAAVLVPVVESHSELSILFTRRTHDLPDHPGQISFPGGRLESDEEGPEQAALRETEEEIGLDRRHVSIIGRLDEYVTRTGFSVTPLVGMVSGPFELSPDSREVAETFEVPLNFLLDPANQQRHERIIDGRERHFFAFSYKQYFIWGATAGMLINLYQRMTET
ncbi:MAG: CoA pyrophosphatase, partial [Rhodospirillales bacterium]|nr:CoA pyrophosphatase [Rhodospirillales bacterium]